MAEAFPVSGNIDPQSFPHLLVDLHRHGATGSLKVERARPPQGALLPRRPRPVRLVERPARPARRDPDRERPHHARAARRGERQGRARQPARQGAGRERLRQPARAGRGRAHEGRAHPRRRAGVGLRHLRVRGRRAAEGRRRPQALDREAAARRRAARRRPRRSRCGTWSCRPCSSRRPRARPRSREVRADVWPLLERLDGQPHAQGRDRAHAARRVRGREDRLRDAVPRHRAQEGRGRERRRGRPRRGGAERLRERTTPSMYTVPLNPVAAADMPASSEFAFTESAPSFVAPEPEPAAGGRVFRRPDAVPRGRAGSRRAAGLHGRDHDAAWRGAHLHDGGLPQARRGRDEGRRADGLRAKDRGAAARDALCASTAAAHVVLAASGAGIRGRDALRPPASRPEAPRSLPSRRARPSTTRSPRPCPRRRSWYRGRTRSRSPSRPCRRTRRTQRAPASRPRCSPSARLPPRRRRRRGRARRTSRRSTRCSTRRAAAQRSSRRAPAAGEVRAAVPPAHDAAAARRRPQRPRRRRSRVPLIAAGLVGVAAGDRRGLVLPAAHARAASVAAARAAHDPGRGADDHAAAGDARAEPLPRRPAPAAAATPQRRSRPSTPAPAAARRRPRRGSHARADAATHADGRPPRRRRRAAAHGAGDGRALLRQGSFPEAARVLRELARARARAAASASSCSRRARPRRSRRRYRPCPARSCSSCPVTFQGRSCYRLCWGVYDTRPAAEAARDSVPGLLPPGRHDTPTLAAQRTAPLTVRRCALLAAALAPASPLRRRGRLHRAHERARDRGASRPGSRAPRSATGATAHDLLGPARARRARRRGGRRPGPRGPGPAPEPRAPGRRESRRRRCAPRGSRSSATRGRRRALEALGRGAARARRRVRARGRRSSTRSRSSPRTRARSSCSATRSSRPGTSRRPASSTSAALALAPTPRSQREARDARSRRRARLERALPHPLRRRRRRAARPRGREGARRGLGRLRATSSASRPSGPVTVVLQTAKAFYDTTRAPGWVAAWNDGTIRVPVAGLERPTPGLVRVLRHELAHSFVASRTGANCPTWLQEGLAQWLEGGDPRREDAALARIARSARAAAARGARGAVRRPVRRRRRCSPTPAACRPSPTCVKQYGLDGLRRLIASLALGRRPPKRCPPRSALSYADLQRAWEQTIVASR